MKQLSGNFEINRYGLNVRLVQKSDAEFIVALRTHSYNSRYLHADGLTVEKQISWIEQYKQREASGEDYYFLFTYEGERVGVIRLYHIHECDFHCGSWAFSDEAPSFCGIAGAVIGREIAFGELGKTIELNCEDGIDARNLNVQRFMKQMGLKMTGERYEGETKYLVGELTKEDFENNKHKIIRFFPKQYQS